MKINLWAELWDSFEFDLRLPMSRLLWIKTSYSFEQKLLNDVLFEIEQQYVDSNIKTRMENEK